jgi:hypothetical protein
VESVSLSGVAYSVSAVWEEAENPKSEARNPKWFGQLTTLSQVEGQYPMFQIQLTKTTCSRVSVLSIGTFVL